MKVFISWSGPVSQEVAGVLRKTLPLMIQSLDVFMSKHDIASGSRWAQELMTELDSTSFGIFCLTRENLLSPWLQFEAGALTKHITGRACGLLLGDLKSADVRGPLAQFQHRHLDQTDFLHLLRDLNQDQDRPLPPDALTTVMAKWWRDIEDGYQVALSSTPLTKYHIRPDRDLLEEILLRLRVLEDGIDSPPGDVPKTAEPVLNRMINYDSLAWYTLWKFPTRGVSEEVQLLLLRDLDPTKYRTILDVDRAVNRAHEAVTKYAEENPSWFQYGTDYITKSLGFVDQGFRARHAFAPRTLHAFQRYQHLIV